MKSMFGWLDLVTIMLAVAFVPSADATVPVESRKALR